MARHRPRRCPPSQFLSVAAAGLWRRIVTAAFKWLRLSWLGGQQNGTERTDVFRVNFNTFVLRPGIGNCPTSCTRLGISITNESQLHSYEKHQSISNRNAVTLTRSPDDNEEDALLGLFMAGWMPRAATVHSGVVDLISNQKQWRCLRNWFPYKSHSPVDDIVTQDVFHRQRFPFMNLPCPVSRKENGASNDSFPSHLCWSVNLSDTSAPCRVSR